jgi:hypothetical protein
VTSVQREDERSVAGIPYERILALEGYPDGSDTPVYLSGSMVTPLGNAWSDIDVFVLGDRAPVGALSVEGDVYRTNQHFIERRRVDYEFWRPAHVRGLADRLAALELGLFDHVARGLFTYSEECFIHRLRLGVPMLNAERFHAFQVLFDFDKLGAYQAQEVLQFVDAWYEDVCGMLQSDDLGSAMLSARHLVGLSVDAYLHKRGNTDPTVKWRARHLDLFDDGSTFHKETVAAYWRLEFPEEVGRGASEAARRRYVDDCLAFSRRVTSWIQS